MALKTIMLRRDIERAKAELEALREKDAEFVTREAELETAIGETETDEQREAVAAEVEAFDTEKAAHEAAKETLSSKIEDLEKQLAEEERKVPELKTPEQKKAFMEGFNFRKMTEQDQAVWKEITDHLNS